VYFEVTFEVSQVMEIL